MTALLASDWVLVVLFAMAVLDGLFPPVPSETALIALAAAHTGGGSPPVALVVIVAVAGACSGDQLTYQIGKALNGRPPRRGARGTRTLERGRALVLRRGGPMLLAARFVPGGRAAVTVAAGAAGFPRVQFTRWTGAGAGLWACFYALIGTAAGDLWDTSPWLAVAVGVGCGSGVGFLVDRVLSSRRARRRSVL